MTDRLIARDAGPRDPANGKRRPTARKTAEAANAVIDLTTDARDVVIDLTTARAPRAAEARTVRRGKPLHPADPSPLDRFAALSGALKKAPDAGPYRVRYRPLQGARGLRRVLLSLTLALLNVGVDIWFFAWYLGPNHYDTSNPNTLIHATNIAVLVTLGAVESLRLINVLSLSLASVIARDPIPVEPPDGLRVAFATTYVPRSEPFDMLARTLKAARAVRYTGGTIDVWVLDEGNEPKVRRLCSRLRVRHFSRAEQPHWNEPEGRFKRRTKHGNYNAWIDHLSRTGTDYDVILGVDTDHVPVPSYAERLLGYFRDPDVAFVVAPQFYGNCDERLLTRGAESQQFPFHSLIQRAANRFHGPMLVGTNFAVRLSALRSVDGLSDSITEDMATGLDVHATRNPVTGKRWRSVYTPDLVAVGEGPRSWAAYLNQQIRWSRGTFEMLLGRAWSRILPVGPGKALHYALIMSFYPSMAIGWLCGIANVVLVLGIGANGPAVALTSWVLFYVIATCTQLALYVLHRDHNVSPFEKSESAGLIGMLMSVLAAPIYASALLATLRKGRLQFVVTAKGGLSDVDRPASFRRHLTYGALIVAVMCVGLVRGTEPLVAYAWPCTQLLVCLVPALWALAVSTRLHAVESDAVPEPSSQPSAVVA